MARWDTLRLKKIVRSDYRCKPCVTWEPSPTPRTPISPLLLRNSCASGELAPVRPLPRCRLCAGGFRLYASRQCPKSIFARFIVKKSTLQAKAWAGFLLAAFGLMTTLSARASPMMYSATVVTDIRVGTHLYHNAAVTVTFEGDSKDIVEATDSHGNPVPSTFCKTPSTTGWFYLLPKGTAQVSVESQGHRLSAHLQPDQIFVASDQCNGGIGFGSFVGPNGLEPAYPLAFVLEQRPAMRRHPALPCRAQPTCPATRGPALVTLPTGPEP